MRTKAFRLFKQTPVLAALLAGAVFTAQAQTWETVYNSASDGVSGVSGDVGVDTFGNVYSVGRYIAQDGSSMAIVQGSADQGDTWQVLDQYAEPGLNYTHNRAFAANSLTGGLLAGGNLNNLLPDGTYQYDTLWFIREWRPDTGVWETVDDSSDLANDVGQASCADILVTPNGDVYATGGSAPGWGLGWVVRRRLHSESAFTTVDADYSGQSTGGGNDLAFHPDYGVFAVGGVNGIWTVRRSSSGELGSWETKDSFTVERQWGSGMAICILVAQNGDIYVGGNANYLSDSNLHWVVRRSTDGGETWSIVDDMSSGEVHGLTEDASGHVLACGQVYEIDRRRVWRRHWIVRRWQEVTHTTKIKGKTYTTASEEFATIDDYQVEPGKDSRANAITADAPGNIYVSGNGLDANGIERFIVRRLPAQ